MSKRPIVCICGSTKFKREFEKVNRDFTLAGYIVLTVGFFMHSEPDLTITEYQKLELDKLHIDKIMLADMVYVVNVGGYIGQSTRNEITSALMLGKKVSFYEPCYDIQARKDN